MNDLALTTTNIRLPAADLQDLKVVALKKGESLAALLRGIIVGFLAETKTVSQNLDRDPIWQWGQKPIKTGDPLISQKIDETLYG